MVELHVRNIFFSYQNCVIQIYLNLKSAHIRKWIQGFNKVVNLPLLSAPRTKYFTHSRMFSGIIEIHEIFHLPLHDGKAGDTLRFGYKVQIRRILNMSLTNCAGILFETIIQRTTPIYTDCNAYSIVRGHSECFCYLRGRTQFCRTHHLFSKCHPDTINHFSIIYMIRLLTRKYN